MPIFEKIITYQKQAEQIRELTKALDSVLKQNKDYRQQIGELKATIEKLTNAVASNTFKDFGN